MVYLTCHAVFLLLCSTEVDSFVMRVSVSFCPTLATSPPQRPISQVIEHRLHASKYEDEGLNSGSPLNHIPGNKPLDNVNMDDDVDDLDDDYGVFIATKIPTQDSPFWAMGNCFDQFLNQCTIQSLMYLLKTCRDPQTVLWIEKFTRPQIILATNFMVPEAAMPLGGSDNCKLLTYHGLAAMNTTAFPTWDSYFARLLEQPKEFYIIESSQTHIPSYEMDINPASICTRMISVREQIAREFAKDLPILSNIGEQTMQSYWQGIRDMAAEGRPDPLRSAYAGSLLFLELDQDGDYIPSPLRKGNFDLLLLLATQESIHRALNIVNDEPNLPVHSMTKPNRQFLSNYYLNRLVSHFTGRQRYGRADEFLQELLRSTPTLSTRLDDEEQNGDSAEFMLVDPCRIAEQLLEIRHHVAIEWAQRAAAVPDFHMEIKRLQLNLLLQSYEPNKEGFQ